MITRVSVGHAEVRLGGARGLTFGVAAEPTSDYARKTFGTQKGEPRTSLALTRRSPLTTQRANAGISSDMYHQTGAYDANSAREAQNRLQSFNGATSISSNQYYGRDDDETQEMEDSILGANGLGGLEAGARDAVRTIMEQTGIESLDDVQGALRQGALKVSRLRLLFALSGGALMCSPDAYS